MLTVSAFDTTATYGLLLKPIKSGIHLVYNELKQVKIPDYPGSAVSIPTKLIFGGVEKEDRVPHFDHAMIMDKSAFIPALASDALVFDMRNYAYYDAALGKVRSRYITDYNFAILRLALQKRWMDAPTTTLRDVSIIPVALFSSLISETLKRRLALDAGAQAQVAVLAAYYYLCQFMTTQTRSESELHKFVEIIKRATYLESGKIYDIIEPLPAFNTIAQFCDVCKEVSNAPQLKEQLNTVLLYTLTKNTWFGPAAERIMAASLEHPPTWLAIAISSLMEMSFQKSQIGRLAERYKKTDAADNMIKSVMGLFGGRDEFKAIFNTENL